MTEKEKEIDIFKHELVPQHRILTEEEKKKFLEKYGARPQDLPRISHKDPAVKAINAKPNDIIEIIRDSPTAGKSKYYRIVTQK